MSWTAPDTFVAGTIFTAASANTNIRDNTLALKAYVDELYALSFQQVPFFFGGTSLFPIVQTSYLSGTGGDKIANSTSFWSVDVSKLQSGVYKLEAMLAIDSGTVTLGLFNLSDGSPDTAMVEITSTSAVGARVQSGAITFPVSGTKVFAVKPKSSGGAQAYVWGIRVVRIS